MREPDGGHQATESYENGPIVALGQGHIAGAAGLDGGIPT